ncbi:hypothetical protein BH10BAC2_BH10BAC2_14110 [soil metagenome]
MELPFFQESIEDNKIPASISVYLQAMWHDGRGDWDKAHGLVDSLTDTTACWVHAYLHRKEGDLWNADYWYSKAGEERPDIMLEQEWEILVKALL